MEKVKILLVILSAILTVVTSHSNEEVEVGKYVDEVCEIFKKKSYETSIVSWNFESNITDYNQKKNAEQQEKYAEYSKSVAMELLKHDYNSFENVTLKRLIKRLVDIGDDILEVNDFRQLRDLISKMQGNYAKVKIPSYRDKTVLFQLEPEITEILVESSDPNELEYYWTQWYDLAGTPCKENFFKYVELKNKAARLNSKFYGI